jgi:diketogulonate reductase-like aldo/keto reductase
MLAAFSPAGCNRLQLDCIDPYLIHTPFAFRPGDNQDPRDQNGNVIYDEGITLMDTWRAMEDLVDDSKCKAIGLSDVSLDQLREIFKTARSQSRRGPSRVPSPSAADRDPGIL